ELVTATSVGLYRCLLASSPPASVTWWAGVLAAALVMGSLGLAVLGLDRLHPVAVPRPPAVPRHRSERPFLGVEVYVANVMDAPPRPPAEHEVSRELTNTPGMLSPQGQP